MERIRKGDRVRHNYESGHGIGSVVAVRENYQERFAYSVLWDSGVGPEPYTYNDETQEIAPVGLRDRVDIVMRAVNDERYESDLGYVLAREHGETPNGNPISGRWVLRDRTGTMLEIDQYRNDIACWWHLELN